MFDRHLRPLIDRSLEQTANGLARRGVSANMLTGAGLAVGLLAALCVWLGLFPLALMLAAASRLLDGLDGLVARATRTGPLGGYLDILADFSFYAALPLGFVLYDPGANAVAGAVLLAGFFINAASFLGFAVLAEQHSHKTDANGEKSHYHATGLIEGSETIVFFTTCLIRPDWFAPLALVFAALVLWTVLWRTWLAGRVFR